MTFKAIQIPVEDIVLKGRLRIAKPQKGLIVFSHGSGSSRLSSRNNYVAEFLQQNGFSSLLFDLLTEKEDLIYENRFNIHLLAQRLIMATQWVSKLKETSTSPIGLFGASTGAASALIAATHPDLNIKAVVSRGGRPDLAASILENVSAPTLLIVGGNDGVVIALNQKAYAKLEGTKKLEIVEGATHLFSEPGKLEIVSNLTCSWFNEHLK